MARRSRTAFAEPEYRPEFIDDVQALSHPLDGCGDLDPLIDRIGDARFVLLGEASHGTAEYYEWRRRISQRLIRDKGFSFIAVEGDWPDSYRVNRYVKGRPGAGANAHEVLHEFERWPTWMWANEEVVELAEWLREHNASVPEERKAGFYGLDVYSLWESMEAVLGYLGRTDGEAVEAARRAFECFEPFGHDEHEYARATMWAPQSCEDEVVRMLHELRLQAPKYEHDGREEFFNAEQNALVSRNAEHYYRTMVRGDAQSWNVRDGHMVETLNRLVEFHGEDCKAIVWEHNTHIGDARYTDMAADGMVNVGELVRQQRQADGVVLVGFSSYRGTVIAGDYWGAPMRKMPMPPGRPGSWEDALHHVLGVDALLVFNSDESGELLEPRGHRAIGVVYRPDIDAFGNYVPTILPRRYDALAYFDWTHALHPLNIAADVAHEVPETYPSGV
jgi:erythromycin esterase-like protein